MTRKLKQRGRKLRKRAAAADGNGDNADAADVAADGDATAAHAADAAEEKNVRSSAESAATAQAQIRVALTMTTRDWRRWKMCDIERATAKRRRSSITAPRCCATVAARCSASLSTRSLQRPSFKKLLEAVGAAGSGANWKISADT
jgi:hypothetical protein